MELLTLLLALIVGLVGVWAVKKSIFFSKLPPGPWGLPVIGQLLYLNRNNALKIFQKWRLLYGNIFCFSMGDFYVIVLNDYKVILDALKRDEFQGRPDFLSWKERNEGIKNRGILFSDAVSSWSEQRRFSLRSLRDFGFGKQSMEGLLQHELKQLIQTFKVEGADGKGMEMQSAFNASVFNSLWLIVTGERFELDDPQFHNVLSKVQGHLQNMTFTNAGNYYPWPAKKNIVRRGLWSGMMEMYAGIFELIDKIIQEHVDTYDENQTRDYIDAYLHHANHTKEHPTSSFNHEQWRKSLKVVLLDLFSAGTETSSTTLLWAILFMTKFPHIQDKLHKEVDEVIGKGRLPQRDDKERMPYLEAFTNEVHRKSSLLPMSVYHKITSDIQYGGYLFPKGAVIYPNLHQVHHDPKYWGDPHNFRPERFLDESGKNLVKREALIPFSTGKRICLGETLARDTLFIFLAGLLQSFRFQLHPSSENYDFMSQMKPMFVVAPDPFKIIIHAR